MFLVGKILWILLAIPSATLGYTFEYPKSYRRLPIKTASRTFFPVPSYEDELLNKYLPLSIKNKRQHGRSLSDSIYHPDADKSTETERVFDKPKSCCKVQVVSLADMIRSELPVKVHDHPELHALYMPSSKYGDISSKYSRKSPYRRKTTDFNPKDLESVNDIQFTIIKTALFNNQMFCTNIHILRQIVDLIYGQIWQEIEKQNKKHVYELEESKILKTILEKISRMGTKHCKDVDKFKETVTSVIHLLQDKLEKRAKMAAGAVDEERVLEDLMLGRKISRGRVKWENAGNRNLPRGYLEDLQAARRAIEDGSAETETDFGNYQIGSFGSASESAPVSDERDFESSVGEGRQVLDKTLADTRGNDAEKLNLIKPFIEDYRHDGVPVNRIEELSSVEVEENIPELRLQGAESETNGEGLQLNGRIMNEEIAKEDVVNEQTVGAGEQPNKLEPSWRNEMISNDKTEMNSNQITHRISGPPQGGAPGEKQDSLAVDERALMDGGGRQTPPMRVNPLLGKSENADHDVTYRLGRNYRPQRKANNPKSKPSNNKSKNSRSQKPSSVQKTKNEKNKPPQKPKYAKTVPNNPRRQYSQSKQKPVANKKASSSKWQKKQRSFKPRPPFKAYRLYDKVKEYKTKVARPDRKSSKATSKPKKNTSPARKSTQKYTTPKKIFHKPTKTKTSAQRTYTKQGYSKFSSFRNAAGPKVNIGNADPRRRAKNPPKPSQKRRFQNTGRPQKYRSNTLASPVKYTIHYNPARRNILRRAGLIPRYKFEDIEATEKRSEFLRRNTRMQNGLQYIYAHDGSGRKIPRSNRISEPNQSNVKFNKFEEVNLVLADMKNKNRPLKRFFG